MLTYPKPGIFTLDASGTGQAAVLNQDGGVNSATNPAEILYAGAAPGLIAGVLQINARVPDSVPSGNVGLYL